MLLVFISVLFLNLSDRFSLWKKYVFFCLFLLECQQSLIFSNALLHIHTLIFDYEILQKIISCGSYEMILAPSLKNVCGSSPWWVFMCRKSERAHGGGGATYTWAKNRLFWTLEHNSALVNFPRTRYILIMCWRRGSLEFAKTDAYMNQHVQVVVILHQKALNTSFVFPAKLKHLFQTAAQRSIAHRITGMLLGCVWREPSLSCYFGQICIQNKAVQIKWVTILTAMQTVWNNFLLMLCHASHSSLQLPFSWFYCDSIYR